ncbi:MAG: hypothetical protein MI723_08720 [Caulobacterales bacterium]|nr:hypothetical protein [Caulobacterales bacterium]
MLLIASVLTVLVGALHSLAGGRRLIGPIARLDGLPVILRDPRLTRLTLRAGWHALSVTWWAMAAAMAVMQARPDLRSDVFLWMVSGLFGACGLAALVLSAGRHPSWLMFLPVAALTALSTSAGAQLAPF